MANPRPGAAYPTTASLVGTIEAVEDMGKVFSMDADPVVGDRDKQRLVSIQPDPNDDVPAGLGAIDGVADNVSQRLVHAHPVEAHVREVVV